MEPIMEILLVLLLPRIEILPLGMLLPIMGSLLLGMELGVRPLCRRAASRRSAAAGNRNLRRQCRCAESKT
jgi:hypothetical protein